MKQWLRILALAILMVVSVACASPAVRTSTSVNAVTVTFSSPQDSTFFHKVGLNPDTLSAHDSRSVFLAHVPDSVTQIDVLVEGSATSSEAACSFVEYAQKRPGTHSYEGTRQSSRYRLVLPPPEAPEKEFYAANILVRFCGLTYSGFGPDLSKRTYYLGLWYGPEERLSDRAKGIKALPIASLEQSVYVR